MLDAQANENDKTQTFKISSNKNSKTIEAASISGYRNKARYLKISQNQGLSHINQNN